jgi:hypothetical protein
MSLIEIAVGFGASSSAMTLTQPLSLSAEQASSLTTDLCQLGEDQSAGVIDDAVRSATRYGLM